MAFSDFKYPDVLQQLGLTFDNADNLFPTVVPLSASSLLAQQLQITSRLASTINTEKARSEWLVAPVLADFWARYHGRIGVYSGVNFVADTAAGLNGYCDYLVSRSPQQMVVTPPVLLVFEAKNENVAGGLGQCIAGMVGAQRYNRRPDTPDEPIYGCVTTGSVWRFLRLTGTTVTLDLPEYTITQVDHLLGIMAHIIGPPPAPAAAA